MKRLSLLACALAAGVGLWMLARDAGRDGRPAPPLESAAGGPASGDAPPAAAAGGSLAAGALDPAESTGRSAVPAAETPPANGVTIAVVAREGGTPVADALVSFVDERDVIEQGALGSPDESVDDLVARFARRFRTDDGGLVVVPRPHGAGLVTGETDELWGLLMLSEDDLVDLRLELDPDPPLAVRVVDEARAPVAGLPVALRQDLGPAVTDVLIAETDATGVAMLRHARPMLERIAAVEGPRPTLVALAVLLAEPVERAIDVDAFPRAPVELVLPSTGSVEVRLELPDGAPAEGPRVVRMSVDDRARRRVEPVEVFTRSGRAVFEHVGLGLELAVGADAGHGAARREHRASGPRSPGEHVIVRVTLHETLLVGRAVDPGGAPLVRTLVRCELLAGDGVGLDEGAARTDETGRFRLPVGRNRRPDGWDGRFELGARAADGSELAARVAVPTLHPGENPLGDVVLAPPPRIAAGTVVDAAGEPVAGARVLLVRVVDALSLTVRNQRATTDAAGRFEIRGFLEADRVSLSADHEATLPSDTVEVDRGASDVVLRLAGAGRIAGRLLLDERVSLDRLRVEAISETTGERSQVPLLERDGSFELPGLAPGTYRLVVQLREEPDCQVVLAGILVGPGEAGADERLAAIDLRDRVRAFTLRVFDAEGEPLAHGRVRRRPAGAERFGAHASWLREGRLELVTCEPALDLEIDAVGHRPELLPWVASDRLVHLRAGPRVRLALVGEIPTLPEDVRLVIRVVGEREGDGNRWVRNFRSGVGPDGTVDVQLQDPGPHRILVELVRGDAPAVVVSERPEGVIDVRDVDERQAFELRLSPATLRRLREAQ